MSECIGMCLTGNDIGVPSNAVAYPHPLCPEHGDGCDSFHLDRPDGLGRWLCRCGAYQTDHVSQMTLSLLDLEIERELVGGYTDNASELTAQRRALTAVAILEIQEAS